jgi:lipopolysaccharide/colanic/teichoic acid biosynthesis glycosyltransferase
MLNVIVAAVGIVLTLPLMAIIALAIRLTSPGPVLFTQPRIGVDRRRGNPPPHILELRREDMGGRLFTIFKFRTMTVQSGPQAQVWASENDPRITAVGRLLRRTRLDELPQLFNVLQGDMNIVGPRPEQPRIFQELRERIDGYQQRQKVLPGITGWAQVNQSYDQDLDDVRRKVALDLQYIEERSAVRDFMIMLRTVPVMLFRRGAL